MKCPNCGTEVGNAKFCTECGTPLKAGLVRGTAPQEDNEKKKPKRKGCGCLTAIVVVLVLGMIGSSSDAGSTSTTVSKPSTAASSSISRSSEPELTMGQRNALRAAANYLSAMAFSHDGLIKQLEYEGYSTEDATYAADHCGANWNEQAAKSAKNYLSAMSFSRSGLIQQLEYEGFTASQAEYGASANGY
jgi:hypothetical protein